MASQSTSSSVPLLEGQLFVYNKEKGLAAFRSGKSPRMVIWVGGLTDGLFSLGFVQEFARELEKIGWSLVQPILSSSYLGYGVNSLFTDVEELDDLVSLLYKEFSAETIVLGGHSTGSQDTVMYGLKGKNKIHVSGLILQAAVSDRDFFGQDPASKQHLELATQKLAEGKGKELMDRSVNFAPITYYRYHSFLARLGDDDMFSNDLTDEELESILGKIEIPILIVQSLKDQYVPPNIDIAALGKRFVKAVNNKKEKELASLVLIEGADHSLTSPECSQKFVEAVTKFLQTKELVGRQE